jgi:hypothetical protein
MLYADSCRAPRCDECDENGLTHVRPHELAVHAKCHSTANVCWRAEALEALETLEALKRTGEAHK